MYTNLPLSSSSRFVDDVTRIINTHAASYEREIKSARGFFVFFFFFFVGRLSLRETAESPSEQQQIELPAREDTSVYTTQDRYRGEVDEESRTVRLIVAIELRRNRQCSRSREEEGEEEEEDEEEGRENREKRRRRTPRQELCKSFEEAVVISADRLAVSSDRLRENQIACSLLPLFFGTHARTYIELSIYLFAKCGGCH